MSTIDKQEFEKFEKNGWEQAASSYHLHWGGLTTQSACAMLDVAEIVTGTSVLDVATGAGYVAAAASKRGAHVTGLDFSAAQIKLAASAHPEVSFIQASAEDMPFDVASFDAVVMGFGMNHMPDPERTIVEAGRVLRPGGVMAFTVWENPNPGEGFGIVLSALEELGVSTPKLPPGPPYFQFADPDVVTEIFCRCGFEDVHTKIVPQVWHHQSPDQLYDAFSEGAVRATAMLQAQPAEVRDKIKLRVRAEVKRLQQENGRYRVPVPAALSWARRVS